MAQMVSRKHRRTLNNASGMRKRMYQARQRQHHQRKISDIGVAAWHDVAKAYIIAAAATS